MKYLKTFENLHDKLDELSNSFVNNLSDNFKEDLLLDKDTFEDNGTIITNDTIFYFLIGKYITMNDDFAKKYDNLSESDQEEVDELNTDKICIKFNIEF